MGIYGRLPSELSWGGMEGKKVEREQQCIYRHCLAGVAHGGKGRYGVRVLNEKSDEGNAYKETVKAEELE